MTLKRFRLLPLLGVTLALVLSGRAHAVNVTFTVDMTGGATGQTPIANTTANTGKYAAGSWLTFGGNVAASASGLTATGNFAAQKASSGAFSSGNPGSLTSYYTGTLNASIDYVNNTISFGGGAAQDASLYNAHYPEVPGAVVPLSPMIGGGTSTAAPGSDPADYGISLKVAALGGLVTVANGTAAVRNVLTDVTEVVPGKTQALTPAGAGTQTFVTANNLQIQLTGGDLDFNLKGSVVLGNTVPDIFGTTPVSGAPPAITTGGVGTVVTTMTGGGFADIMITVPIKSTVVQVITGDTPLTATITLTGQLVAYATHVQLVPEPASVALAAIAGCAILPVCVRKYRRSRSKV